MTTETNEEYLQREFAKLIGMVGELPRKRKTITFLAETTANTLLPKNIAIDLLSIVKFIIYIGLRARVYVSFAKDTTAALI